MGLTLPRWPSKKHHFQHRRIQILQTEGGCPGAPPENFRKYNKHHCKTSSIQKGVGIKLAQDQNGTKSLFTTFSELQKTEFFFNTMHFFSVRKLENQPGTCDIRHGNFKSQSLRFCGFPRMKNRCKKNHRCHLSSRSFDLITL